MKILITMLLIASVFACSSTPELIYIEPQPYAFQKTETQKPRAIRVHKNDKPLYKAYIDSFRAKLTFHNEQIDAYLKSFTAKEKVKNGL